ncbi:MAG: prepilin-type N-terminal cleavage/methylation domain-containing protein [Gammaproteobacteria bacterium]|nr:prepilin-type N-terminal cleavage/methylation domain-containing protein [Gammaproteobacteria bacterium]
MRAKGLTLIEFIIAILILGIVAGVAAAWLDKGLLAGAVSTNIVERSWHARLALQRIANDLLFLSSFSNTSSTSMINFTDVNGSTDSYTLSGGSILRNGTSVANYINNLNFNYVDSSFNYTSNMSQVMCIYIFANVTMPPGESSHGVLPLQTIVCPRRLQ